MPEKEMHLQNPMMQQHTLKVLFQLINCCYGMQTAERNSAAAAATCCNWIDQVSAL
jgi:hypothetical protein